MSPCAGQSSTNDKQKHKLHDNGYARARCSVRFAEPISVLDARTQIISTLQGAKRGACSGATAPLQSQHERRHVQRFSVSALQRFSTSAFQRVCASTLQRFSACVLLRFCDSALVRFPASAIQRFSASVLQCFNASVLQRCGASAL